jgi:hypothetical protein
MNIKTRTYGPNDGLAVVWAHFRRRRRLFRRRCSCYRRLVAGAAAAAAGGGGWWWLWQPSSGWWLWFAFVAVYVVVPLCLACKY